MQKNESVASLFAAGMDMFMIPSHNQMDEYISYTKMGLQNKTISMQRLNDAVARILSVKLALGMVDIESGLSEEKPKFEMPQHETTEYEDSLNAVRETLVMLKNENNVVPVKAS
jgi:beta-glucosidase